MMVLQYKSDIDKVLEVAVDGKKIRLSRIDTPRTSFTNQPPSPPITTTTTDAFQPPPHFKNGIYAAEAESARLEQVIMDIYSILSKHGSISRKKNSIKLTPTPTTRLQSPTNMRKLPAQMGNSILRNSSPELKLYRLSSSSSSTERPVRVIGIKGETPQSPKKAPINLFKVSK